MYSREDVVKLLLSKRGVDPYATGGVRKIFILAIFRKKFERDLLQQLSHTNTVYTERDYAIL